jgi:hypothetical protein
MKDHTDLKIALAILIPSFLAVAAIVIMLHPVVEVEATSNANCDKAGISENNGGNQRGNAGCFFRGDPDFDNSDPEPIRSAKSPQCQGDKPGDNDEDAHIFCRIRGN